jgi:branched-chain amino acid transport system ATP-binding protein
MADAHALSLRGLTRRYGALTAVSDVTLDVVAGSRHALIGPNGAGKSTLFNLIAGTLRASEGQILLHDHDVTKWSASRRARRGLAKTFQHSSLFMSMSPIENVALAAQRTAGFGMALHRSASRRRAGIDDVAERCVEQVGLSDRATIPAGFLSHGESRQLEVAVALATNPRVLLLDEPAAGMSPAESARFSDLIEGLPQDITVLLIEHDLDLVFRLADRVSVLHLGALLADGTPDEVRSNPEVQHAYLGKGALEELFTSESSVSSGSTSASPGGLPVSSGGGSVSSGVRSLWSQEGTA